jgi:hypothetical protein
MCPPPQRITLDRGFSIVISNGIWKVAWRSSLSKILKVNGLTRFNRRLRGRTSAPSTTLSLLNYNKSPPTHIAFPTSHHILVTSPYIPFLVTPIRPSTCVLVVVPTHLPADGCHHSFGHSSFPACFQCLPVSFGFWDAQQ